MRTTRRLFARVTFALVALTGGPAAGQPSRLLDDYVLLAVRSLTLKDGGRVQSGHVGLNEASGRWLVLGPGSFLADGTALVADAVRGSKASVYDLYANRLFRTAFPITVRGAGPLPTGPLPLIDPLPPLPPSVPGSGTIVVTGEITLAPGAYGDIIVPNDATLRLTGGTYDLRSLRAGRRTTITAEAPTILNLAGTFRLGNESLAGPQPPLTTAALRLHVGGPLVVLGSGAQARMELYAPGARLRLGRGLQGVGQFVARDISSDHSTRFARGDCGNGVIEPGEQCDPPDGVGCDAACRLVSPGTTTTSTTSTTVPTTSTTSTTVPTTSTTSTTVPTTTSTSTTVPTTTSTSTTAPTTTSTSTTTTLTAPTTTVPPTTTTSTTMPPAICGNRELEFPEECDPPGSTCPPDGLCQDDCTCLFGGGS